MWTGSGSESELKFDSDPREKTIMTIRIVNFDSVFRIRMDPHNRRPPGSGSAWTDTDPDPGGEKLRNKTKK